MKTVKITLSVIVVTGIVVAVIWGFMSLKKSDEIQLSGNTNTKTIEQKIDLLKKMPESTFCDSLNKEIKDYIEMDYSEKRLGKTPPENEQWKKNLSSNLYAAYTDKFIKQAFYVFKGSEWEVRKLNFIRTEYQSLQREGNQTGMLEKSTVTDQKLNEIKNIFLKYDEITGFINLCKAFSFKVYDNLDAEFPISTIEQYIIRSKKYLENNLENDYLRECTRLKANLSEVPQILFYAHVRYLDGKINYWTEKYTEINSFTDYKEKVYNPLLEEIEQLYNDNYDKNIIETAYKTLKDKLEKEGDAVYQKFN